MLKSIAIKLSIIGLMISTLTLSLPANAVDSTNTPMNTIAPSNINRSGSTVPTTPSTVYNEQYGPPPQPGASYSACPANPVCPDINGNYPSGQTPNCPLTCVAVRSMATMLFSSQVVSSQGMNGVGNITVNGYVPTAVQDAICPPNYSMVGVFNMGPEVVNNNWSGTSIVPTSISDYMKLLSYGYTCNTNNMLASIDICVPTQYAYNMPWLYYPRYGTDRIPPGFPVNDNHYSTNLVVWKYNGWNYGCWSEPTCGAGGVNPDSPCNYNSYYRIGYNVYDFMCTCSWNMCETLNMAPTAIACTFNNPQWMQLNK